jgi:hypothetical protein
METLDDWRTLADALADDLEYAVILGERWRPEGEDWLWEAMKWFELQPDTVLVGGRLVDDTNVVADAGLARRGNQDVPVYRGLRQHDPGALARRVLARGAVLTLLGISLGLGAAMALVPLLRIISAGLQGSPVAYAGVAFGEVVSARRPDATVYSPLLEARRHSTSARPGPVAAADRLAFAPGDTLIVGSA